MGLIGSKQNGDLITLSEKDISIIRHSTHFNEEEIFKYHKIFIETCPNGQIKYGFDFYIIKTVIL